MKKTYIPYGRQSINEDDIQAVVKTLQSDYLTTGPQIMDFEQKVANYCNSKYAVAVSNGTAALHIACMAAGITDKDEVIIPPITFVATSNCVLYRGGTPVFADIHPKTYNIDPAEIMRKITDKTKAIIAVHFSGQPCDMDEIYKIAKAHNLIVIEDAAHALGADYKGRMIGSISDMTIMSFHPVKHITTAEGGMVLTNDKELYKKLCFARTHGITRDTALMENEKEDEPWYYEQVSLGYNYRITDIQCALGISQMNRLNEFIERRRYLVHRYNQTFERKNGIITPYQQEGCHNSYHLYVIQVTNKDRKEVFNALRKDGIGVNVHYIPVYTQPYYRHHGYEHESCPNAELYYKRAISLPMYPELTDAQQDYVIEKVLEKILE